MLDVDEGCLPNKVRWRPRPAALVLADSLTQAGKRDVLVPPEVKATARRQIEENRLARGRVFEVGSLPNLVRDKFPGYLEKGVFLPECLLLLGGDPSAIDSDNLAGPVADGRWEVLSAANAVGGSADELLGIEDRRFIGRAGRAGRIGALGKGVGGGMELGHG